MEYNIIIRQFFKNDFVVLRSNRSKLFNQVFRRKNLVIKINVGGRVGERAVGRRASTNRFRSITPQPFEIF